MRFQHEEVGTVCKNKLRLLQVGWMSADIQIQQGDSGLRVAVSV